ncbi:hypothetical protein ACWGI1_35690 [Streptomyces sp. NPDC054835]
MRGIKVEVEGRVIEWSDASTAERERLIDAFLAHREVPAERRLEERSTEQT